MLLLLVLMELSKDLPPYDAFIRNSFMFSHFVAPRCDIFSIPRIHC